MKHLYDVPIKRKLTLITLVTSGLALLLACAAFTAYEWFVFRASMVDEHQSTARMIGDNSAAALIFNDPDSAAQTLRSLSAHPHVESAAVYDTEGAVVATYQREGSINAAPPPPVAAGGYRFTDEHLELFGAIDRAGESAGFVYLRSDLGALYERLWSYMLIMIAVMASATLAAVWLSRCLQGVIAGPVSHLADIAHAVATGKDYSVRAKRLGDDELGELVDAFNEMLNQIQSRDRALQEARDSLEQRVEERTREVAYERHLLRELLDWSPDGIYFKDRELRYLRTSRSMAQWLKLPSQDAMIGKSDFDLMPKELAEMIRSDEQAIIDTGEPMIGKTEKAVGKKGRTSWYLSSKMPLRDMQGNIIGVFGTTKNITPIKEAEARLEEVHRQLLDISRKAGMAEVATNVLHNVGNVLNSVNTSASLLTDKIRASQIAGVARVAKLLEDNRADLAGFFTQGERGTQLLKYIRTLADTLASEQGAQIQELQHLVKNIDHVKEIVAMQQSYARVSGVEEELVATELVEDALRMSAASFVRHEVELVRDYAPELPRITADKHKVLQILVNLIRNAKHACEDGNPPNKRVTIRVLNGDGRVKITVEDNGVGIAPENLTRIFNHGFTTRADGHGFGLHSGALAAQEMGGSLKAASAGVGQGATFTLELPVQKDQEAATA
jgi:PAS domain S-box-containing protein